MKIRRASIASLVGIGWVSVTPLSAMIHGTDHSSPPAHMAETWGLTKEQLSRTFDVQETATTVPSNVLFPGDEPTITLQIVNLSKEDIAGKAHLDIIPYALKTVEGGSGMFAYEMYRLRSVVSMPVPVEVPAGSFQDIKVKPPIPKQFGGYALVLDIPGQGRKLACGIVRALAQKSEPIQYPTMSLDADVDPRILQRIGIRAVRLGIDYKPTTDPDFPQWLAGERSRMRDLRAHNITALAMVGAGGPQPLGQMRSLLNSRGEGPMGYPGDGAWLPSSDSDFRKYCTLVAGEFGWPKGPITAFSLWNEPWEGDSISGWGADMIRYREMYDHMFAGVDEANRTKEVDVLVGGCDSSSNALDKFFSDGTNKYLPKFDFVSLHYQGLSTPQWVKAWRERKARKGRVMLWDTESWAANTDERILPRLASWRAAGYDRLMGVDASNIADEWEVNVHKADGTTRRVRSLNPWSPAVAEGAVASLIGERPFQRFVFQNGLPWVMEFFDPKAQDNGILVAAGDIRGGNGGDGSFRSVNLIGGKEGSMTLPASKDYQLLDSYANPIPAKNGILDVPLGPDGYYLAPSGKPGSFAKLVSAVRKARVTGYEPVELIAHDMTAPIIAHPVIRFNVTNVQNRPLRGRLAVSLQDLRLERNNLPVTLGPNETKTISMQIAGGQVHADNIYPMKAVFNAGSDGKVIHNESMRCNVIAHRTINVDGSLGDWEGVIPQTIADAKAETVSMTEKAWHPLTTFDETTKAGFAAAYLAYDSNNFYFAAKIADDTPEDGTFRWETIDDDQFFYPEVAIKVDRNDPTKREELRWPEGVRRYTYRKDPTLPASWGAQPYDDVQIAFNAIPEDDVEHKGAYGFPRGTMPHYSTYKDTDYEYALNQVAPKYGGGTEIWRLQVPGMPRKHFYPRQPKSPFDGPVKGGKLVVRRVGNTRIVECSIPWIEMPWVRRRLDANQTVKFTFRVNDGKGPSYELATDRSVSDTLGLTFHPDWERHWSNEVEFGWQK